MGSGPSWGGLLNAVEVDAFEYAVDALMVGGENRSCLSSCQTPSSFCLFHFDHGERENSLRFLIRKKEIVLGLVFFLAHFLFDDFFSFFFSSFGLFLLWFHQTGAIAPGNDRVGGCL